MTGSRWLHAHKPLLKTLSEALYLGLTTAIGLRTLGEEYTDIYQVASSTSQRPLALRRWGFVFAETAGWYAVFNLLWPRLRRQLQLKLESPNGQSRNEFHERVLRAALASVENISAVHLALFYFLGTYYSLPKRIFRIRYVLSSSWPY
jgi:peroxin-10